MKENETQFVIDLEGHIYRQDISYREIDPGEAMQKAFTTHVTTRHRNILELPSHGACHMVFESSTNIQYWSIPMLELCLRTTFGANGAEFFPTFAHKDSAEVPMEVIWNLADAMINQETGMRIRFVAEVATNGPNGFYVRDHYLYAFDPRGAAYKLPLGNLYENCRLCMGDYDNTSGSAAGAVILALKQFRSAPWNSDLFSDEDVVMRFFRFKPLEKGFQTLPIIEDWTRDCSKVGTANLKFIEQ